jgi:hypothetical protein
VKPDVPVRPPRKSGVVAIAAGGGALNCPTGGKTLSKNGCRKYILISASSETKAKGGDR